ncbi:N-acetylmuramoyl-L-alanine amidase [Pasteurella skyensis]|uniref:N-acetylmuramoyl-L-alanine amidase n=1 Tax=Phocoenobacter skyensis TaxID=97481 RepID=A0AAJ6NCM1_9PAST|nr:N-acetylmuramoyl-L-alanine amidase [Pasteurella skyensis]MDP8170098.1 N-acetylmuramoyl-L-alanine amidase [Pasteurella skyensis]MDP8174280.1 N-acetylmuramoyl-L-alanine amidase [Pasteurella skyensis]
MKRKIYATFITCLALSFLTGCVQQPKKTIVIDPGHGGADVGAQSKTSNETESSFALKLADKIIELNKNQNLEIISTRIFDRFIELQERVDKINKIKPDFAISLHVGSYPDRRRNGIGTYYSKKSIVAKKSQQLSQKMLNCLGKGKLKKDSNDSFDGAVLRKTKSPAILINVGFFTNPPDRDYLISKQGQDELAKLIYGCLKEM